MVYLCEICGEPVNAIMFSSDTVVLCSKCINESRKVDGTLNSAYKKIKQIRG
jgi:DNA-directed RNA polymerase subunit RPC12/RpoP